MIKYRLQVMDTSTLDLSWSEWRDINVPFGVRHFVVSMQLNEDVSWDKYNKEIAPQLNKLANSND